MSAIKKMQSYVDKSFTKRAKTELYGLRLSEMIALRNLGDSDFWTMLDLAFNYGRAKGYRMAKQEVQQ